MKSRSMLRWPALVLMMLVGVCIGIVVGYSINNAKPPAPIPIATSPASGPVTPAPDAAKPAVFIPKPVPPVSLTDKVTGLTADEAVDMGYEKFIDRYFSRTKDDSIDKINKANIAYTRLREAKNVAILSTIDPKYANNAKKADELLHTLYWHRVLMAQSLSGGGSMYGEICVSNDVTRADRMGEIYMALRDPKHDSSLRAQAKTDLKLMDTLAREFMDGLEIDEYFSEQGGDESWEADYRKELKTLRRAVSQIRPLCKALPDRAARLAAAAAADALEPIEEGDI